ncbi:MAG TPA: hypothetical protein DDW76_09620 [Cyanobacteria bacterium UBA11369]|nr:hypothetical protein [Cyanobacteria bacterium UBA11371]HBE34977.1 hypothetical protein [Cyanobacteria bacterium UBA11368]HBE49033.1 hypothetical protein [Cyanobacteria bacterium UBA11369]
MNEKPKHVVKAYQCHVNETIPATSKPTHPLNARQQLLKVVEDLFIGDSKQYYGDAFVTPKLQRASTVTHGVAVAANLINVLTAAPVIYFGFRSLGLFGLGLSALLSVAALRISNKTAEAAAASAKGNRGWSDTGLVSFVAMNALLTIISGIGAELLTNGSVLSHQLANQLIQKQSEKIEQIQPDKSLYEAAEKQCAALDKALRELPQGHRDRERIYVQAYGTWAEREKDWTGVPYPQIPRCILSDINRTKANALVQKQREEWNKKLASRLESGNDLQFVQQVLPDVYTKHFAEDGEIRSGTESIALAYDSFFGRLIGGDFSNMGQLGFSLFMFLLSVVTSAGACLLMIAHVHRRDTQLSHNDGVRAAILEHLNYLEFQALPTERSQPNPERAAFSQTAKTSQATQPSASSARTSARSTFESANSFARHQAPAEPQTQAGKQTDFSRQESSNPGQRTVWPASD